MENGNLFDKVECTNLFASFFFFWTVKLLLSKKKYEIYLKEGRYDANSATHVYSIRKV